jgi:hypothetical protein
MLVRPGLSTARSGEMASGSKQTRPRTAATRQLVNMTLFRLVSRFQARGRKRCAGGRYLCSPVSPELESGSASAQLGWS